MRHRSLSLVGLALILILLIVACGGSGSSPSSAPQGSHVNVTYEVSGTAQTAMITYRNASGNTQQEDVTLPWKETFRVERGQFTYISAQSRDDGGRSISCVISGDGEVIGEATSSGRFVIAECSGSAE